VQVVESQANVRFGSKADICAATSHVRFTPNSGHLVRFAACPLCVKNGYFTRLLLRCAEILTKALVRVENNIFAILSFKSSDGKMPARDRLEVVDKCIVDGSSSERTYDRNSLRGSLL
jgi:hypothetical protein